MEYKILDKVVANNNWYEAYTIITSIYNNIYYCWTDKIDVIRKANAKELKEYFNTQ